MFDFVFSMCGIDWGLGGRARVRLVVRFRSRFALQIENYKMPQASGKFLHEQEFVIVDISYLFTKSSASWDAA
jgi:hypothetical protein